MSGGSSSSQESKPTTTTTTQTSTVQGIEDGSMVAGGNITTIDGGAIDLARLAVESGIFGLIEGQGQALDAIEDNARGSAVLVGGSINAITENAKGAANLVGGSINAMLQGQTQALNAVQTGAKNSFDFGTDVLATVESTQSEALAFANETIQESLASYGATALDISKANSSDTTQVLNNALKYGGIGIAALAAGFVVIGALKK